MKRNHSIFKKSHKFIISAIAILLTLSLLPIRAFADEGIKYVDITIEGNGGGNTTLKYGQSTPDNSLAHQMTTNNKRTICVGYRVYAVDKKTGALNKKLGVVDLLDTSKYAMGYTGKEGTNRVTNKVIMIGENKVDPIEKFISFTPENLIITNGEGEKREYDYSQITSVDASRNNGKLVNVFNSLMGWNIAHGCGEEFRKWMTRDNGNNTKMISMYAFDLYTDEEFEDNLINCKLIVEPLILTEIFTNLDYVPVEEKHNNFTVHYLQETVHQEYDKRILNVIDMCCRNDKVNRVKKEEYDNKYTYVNDIKISYNNEVPISMSKLMEIQNSGKYTKDVIKKLGYGDKFYNELTKDQKIEVYNTLKDENKQFQYGLNYLKSYYYDYQINKEIIEKYGAKNIYYADRTQAYSKLNQFQAKGGKHNISVDTGILMMSTYSNIRKYLEGVPRLNGGDGSDNGPLSAYLNTAGTGFYIIAADFGLESGTQGIHIYDPSIAMKIKTAINTYDIDTNPKIPALSEKVKKIISSSTSVDNTGECTIIKVYGEVYKNGSKITGIKDIDTFVTEGTTEEIIIKNEKKETGYDLKQWVVSKTKDTDYKATEWLNTDGTYSFDKKSEFNSNTDGYKLIYEENNPLKIGEKNIIYLLYLKEIEIGTPIHTIGVPSITGTIIGTTPPEQPKKLIPNSDNTGESTIIKVYGEIYKDGSTVHHIGHKVTYSETQTTDWVVIEQEDKYKLVQWIVSSEAPDTNYKATEWLTTDGKYSFDKKQEFSSDDTGYKLTYTAADIFQIGDGNTIYLLYLKEMPCISTYGDVIPGTPPGIPPMHKPENPYAPEEEDKQGDYNIVKVYATLDKYNGSVISTETYTQSGTTQYIKIESESQWNLASWKITDKYNSLITGKDWCGEAITKEHLNEFYQKGYYDISLPSKFGKELEKGNKPVTKYFDTGNTLYVLLIRTDGQADYTADNQIITESYISKRF